MRCLPALILILTVAGVAISALADEPDGLETSARLSDDPVLGDYTSWHELTTEPHAVNAMLWVLCMAPPPEVIAQLEAEYGEHNGHTIRVFATEGADGYDGSEFDFPAGTVLAKAKYFMGGEPVAVAFMTRTEVEDPADGDLWEFSFYSRESTDAPLVAQSMEGTGCRDCHSRQDDWVFGAYLIDPSPISSWP